MAIESILPSDSGKVAFEKTSRNFELMDDKINVLSEKLEWKPNDWKTENSKPSEFGTKTETIFFATTSFGDIFPRASVVVKTTCFSSNYAKQEVFRNDTEKIIKYRLSIGGTDTWGDWQTVATTEQVNVLSGLQNGFKFYYNLKELGLTTTATTEEVFEAMQDKSVLIMDTKLSDYPVNRCTSELTKFSGARCRGVLTSVDGGNADTYVCSRSTSVTPSFTGWRHLATTTKTDILTSDLLNGWTISLSSYDSSITKMGNQVFVKLMVKNEAPNPDTILVLPYPAIKATHLFVTTQNRKSIQCRVVNNTIIISNYQGLEANEWVNINGSYTTNS